MLSLPLGGLAKLVGISASALSQIEKSKSFPSIVTLKGIADSLHTTVGELIGENESLGNNPVVTRQEMKYIDQNKSGTIIYLLSQHDTNKLMDTCLIRFAKASGIEGIFPAGHGQTFCHVLSGEIRFTLDGKNYTLKPGDNIYFNTKTPHDAVNNSEGISELIWIQSPANF